MNSKQAKKKGRPKISEETVQEILSLVAEDMPYGVIAERVNLHTNTVANICRGHGANRSRGRPKLDDEMCKKICEMVKHGYSYQSVSTALGVHFNTVANICRREGVTNRYNNRGRPKVDDDVTRRIAEMIDKGYSYRSIGTALGIHANTVMNVCFREGIRNKYSNRGRPIYWGKDGS